MAAQKAEKPPEFDKAAEAIWNAEFLLVVCGPLYEEGTRPFTSSEYCDPATVSNPNKFMGYWGGIFNECSERTPHEGFNILKSWRDRFFCLEDVRKRQPKKRPEEESEMDRLPRFQAYTRSITGYMSKVGFPSEEIYENCGNIFSWQCSRVPPCCPKVTQVDRGFRFEIEESNQEAQPIKYIQDKREDKPKEFFSVTDSQQEDIQHVNDGISAIALDVKGKDDKGLKRLQRKMDKGQVIKLMPHLQIGHDRFPDRFEGFPTKQKEKPGRPITWESGVPDDPKALNPVNINLSGDGDKKEEKNVPAHLKPIILPCHPPKRASHLLAHVNALDRGMYNDRMATMYPADPEKWEQERQLYYQQVSKLFRSDHSHSAAMQRAKKITYNISVQFTAAEGTPYTGPATNNPQVGSYSTSVLPPRLLDKLLKVGKSVDEEASNNLRKNHVDSWEQGKNGLFYFSNVLSRETHQEPINFQHHDNICVWFPLTEKSQVTTTEGGGKAGAGAGDAASGDLAESPTVAPSPSSHVGGAQPDSEDRVPAVSIPKRGKISVVVETVLDLAEAEAAKENKSNAPPTYGRRPEPKEGDMAPNPCSYTGNTWQLVGTYNPPDFSDPNEFKKNPGKNVVFEYVLEDRRRHVVKIGCLRSDPTAVKYVLVESPCDEETNPTPNVVTTVTRVQKDQPGAGRSSDNFGLSFGSSKPKESSSSTSGHGGTSSSSQDKKKSMLPTPNHQLCTHCHDVARPYVLMTKPGVKDDGFCSQFLAQRTKAYKLWEKQMIDAMKQDNNKSLVLLELGADKKMEPCRAYAEKTFKSLKSSKCTMIRISPHNLETKKKQGGAGAEAQNLLQLQSPVIQGLQNIDRLVMEKMRKKGA